MSTINPLLSNYVAITSDGAVELAENTETKFKRFWKQIAGYGEFVDPRGAGKKMVLDKAWGERIVDNFKNGPIKRVPVPTGHPQTSAELAERNKGWLMDAEARDDGLYGLIEVRKQDAAEDIENGVLADTSVAFDEQYTDKKTGKIFRDVLKHVGLVNDPYIKDMTEFEPALSDGNLATILFSDSEADGNKNNNKEEKTMATVTNDRDFPVEVKYTLDDSETAASIEPGASLEVPDEQLEDVTKQIADAVKPEEELSDEQKKAKELADREAAVAAKEKELSDKAAAAEYERLLSEGKIVPAQKEAYIALSTQQSTSVELADGESKTVGVLLSELFESAPKLALDDEKGKGGNDSKKEEDVKLSDEDKAMAKKLNISEDDMKATKKESEK